MTFPQTTAINALRQGQEYWRLFTPVQTGDVYEIEINARALVIGPQSDIAEAQIIYPDTQAPNNANVLKIGIDKPHIGRLDALATNYESGDLGRLLLSTNDLTPPPGYRPPSAGVGDVVEIIQPRIDVLAYTSNEPVYIPPRVDNVLLFEEVPTLSGAAMWFIVPFYGRRFAEITIKSLAYIGQPAITVNIAGLNFSNNLGPPVATDSGHQQEALGLLAFAAPAGVGITHSLAVVNRSFDALGVQIIPPGPLPATDSIVTHIRTSDRN